MSNLNPLSFKYAEISQNNPSVPYKNFIKVLNLLFLLLLYSYFNYKFKKDENRLLVSDISVTLISHDKHNCCLINLISQTKMDYPLMVILSINMFYNEVLLSSLVVSRNISNFMSLLHLHFLSYHPFHNTAVPFHSQSNMDYYL